ncbi:hypothetical protein Kisp01_55030 [Kineosporia sp. NBRC 101677]|nr:RtcB family protein [Kineosporia sp. NBRC 101677]GLY18489.1 hypothetical protein Kisp01_55030 [Kineosporia sp. NBRC 101677]
MTVERLGKKLYNWASILEEKTREQAARTAEMPFVFPHLALMPDAHLGRGATVGSVIPTDRAIIPAAVGVDIGCGMIAVRTQWTEAEVRAKGDLSALRVAIEQAVPLSAGGYNSDERTTESVVAARLDVLEAKADKVGFDPASYTGKWKRQLGSLGSGNHFIEVTADETGTVWLFLHSGSRGVGNLIAQKHIKVARALIEKWHINLPDLDLAYLVQDTDEFWAYINQMRWAQDFALANREEMMHRLMLCVADFMGEPVQDLESINCFAGETLVTTRTGPRPIESLAGGEHELLTAEGKWVKAPVQSFGRQQVSEVVLSRSGVIKTVRATPGHRWLLRSRRNHEYAATTEELRPGDRLQITFPPRPEGLFPDRMGIARGFVFGDGSKAPTGSRSYANFCGKKDEALIPYFDGIGNPVRTYDKVKRVTGLPREWKVGRPSLDTEPNELYGWLAGYFAADGDVGKTGRPTLASSKREDLEYVRLLAQTIGIGTFGIRSRVRSGFGGPPTPIHLLGLMRGDLDPEFFVVQAHRERFLAGRGAAERRGWTVLSVQPTDEFTEVYCATVEDTHSFALTDNILTGNCHHNFTQQENHFGKNLWVSRKGAIQADAGRPGLIPGSMGTASYVVVGKGNKLSLNSSPHGAGREYSRTAARKKFTVEDLRAAMKGIEYRDTDAFVDEIPGAYKDIDRVMADAEDLVEVKHTLHQLLNVKGD